MQQIESVPCRREHEGVDASGRILRRGQLLPDTTTDEGHHCVRMRLELHECDAKSCLSNGSSEISQIS